MYADGCRRACPAAARRARRRRRRRVAATVAGSAAPARPRRRRGRRAVGCVAPRPGRASDRPHPVQTSSNDSNIRRSAARRRRGTRPASRPMRAAARARRPRPPRRGTGAMPPAPRNGIRSNAMHWPLAMVRSGRLGATNRADRTGRRAWSASPGAATDCPASGSRTGRRRSQIEPVAGRSGHERRRQERIRPGVGVEGDHPLRLAASMPCWSAHALPAHPSGRTCPATTVAPAARAIVAVRVGRLVVDHDHLAHAGGADDRSSSGPIRAASSRAGTTTLMLWVGVIDGRTAGATRAAFARRVNAMPPATTRIPIDRPPDDPAGRRRHPRSCSIISATIRALVVTSGSPPPGWLDPPTRYRPGRDRGWPGGRTRPVAVGRRAVDRSARRAVAAARGRPA